MSIDKNFDLLPLVKTNNILCETSYIDFFNKLSLMLQEKNLSPKQERREISTFVSYSTVVDTCAYNDLQVMNNFVSVK